MNIHHPFYICQRSGAENHRMGKWLLPGSRTCSICHFIIRTAVASVTSKTFLISNRKHTKFLRQRSKFFNSSANCFGKMRGTYQSATPDTQAHRDSAQGEP